jgi:hypothetical protein
MNCIYAASARAVSGLHRLLLLTHFQTDSSRCTVLNRSSLSTKIQRAQMPAYTPTLALLLLRSQLMCGLCATVCIAVAGVTVADVTVAGDRWCNVRFRNIPLIRAPV